MTAVANERTLVGVLKTALLWAERHWNSCERGWRAVILAACILLVVVFGVTIPW